MKPFIYKYIKKGKSMTIAGENFEAPLSNLAETTEFQQQAAAFSDNFHFLKC